MTTTYHSLSGSDFFQDWTNKGLITANDSWAGVPSIMGYLGDIDTAVGADPRTVTGANLGAVDVIADQTAPNTISNGGVAEFDIANPAIALNGSGTADAPSIVLYMNAAGRENVRLTFNARDLDASADNAAQALAVQYRVGDSATWTNLAYDADVTTGGSATEVTAFDIALPSAIANVANLQIRILTTNAAGNDEWVGIDDIRVTSTPAGGDPNPTGQTVGFASGSTSLSQAEGNSGTKAYTFTVERAGGTTGDITFSGTVASSDTDASDYAGGVKPSTFNGTIAAGQSSATVTVNVAGDTTIESDEHFNLTLTQVSNSAAVSTTIGTAGAAGTIVNDDLGSSTSKISEVQGAGTASSKVGQTVTIEAIVVGDFQNGDGDTSRDLNGFYLQEETGDWDANALTSEGLFVFGGSQDVKVGDKVMVTGVVTEYFGLTELTAQTVTIVQAGAVADINDMAVKISLPSTGTTLSQDNDYQPDLEAYEGMLVTFDQTLTITEQFNLDRFNEIKLVAGDRPATFTQDNLPDAAKYTQFLQDLGARTITYDDGLNVQNASINHLDGFDPNDNPASGPNYSTANAPRMGDTITGLTGVLDYQWAGNAASGATWRIRAVENGTNDVVSANPVDAQPEDVGGRLKVASLNVLNYFKTLDIGSATTAAGHDPRGADTAQEFSRQTEKLVNSLLALDADVMSLMEIENDFVPGGSGNAVEYLVQQLNARAGAGTYAWVDPGQRFVGGDAIGVAFIYKSANVEIAEGTTVETLNDADLPALGLGNLVSQSTVGHIFDGENTSRNAVAVTFAEKATGETFTAIANHLKSKSGTGTGADADQGDGQGNWQQQRELAAQALSAWAASDPTGSGDTDVLLLGDFNAYAREDAIRLIEDAGYTNLGVDQGEYSYVFDGQTGTLDDIFANGSMEGQVTGATHWHINSDEADALDYNTDFDRDTSIFNPNSVVRVSDHDPLLIGLDLGEETEEPGTGTPGNDMLVGTAQDDEIHGLSGNDVIQGLAGEDKLYGEAGNDTLIGGEGHDELDGGEGDDLLTGEIGNDHLLGGAGTDVLDGGEGNDTLEGGAGSDIYNYRSGDGADTIIEGAAAGDIDTLFFDDAAEADVTVRRHGQDIELTVAGQVITLKDQLAGAGSGIEMVAFADGASLTGAELAAAAVNRGPVAVTDTGSAGEAETKVFDLIANDLDEDLDTLTLSAFDVASVNGIDLTNEQAKAAFSIDAEGKLAFNPGEMFKTLEEGDTATVTLSYKVSDGHGGEATGTFTLTIDGEGRNLEVITGTAGSDVLTASEQGSAIDAGAGNDYVFGAGAGDVIEAGDGNDYVFGNGGDDIINGGAGHDTLFGGDGNDTLVGGAGNDRLVGGAGTDTFVFRSGFGSDTVMDFADGDVIDVSAAGFADYAALQAHVNDTALGATLTLADGSTLTIANTSKAALAADDFHFAA